jgi:4-amino-4-deoxy-L-arabinose transferase-like glycosyltransferase
MAAGAVFVVGFLWRVSLAFTCRAIPDFSDMAEYNYLAVEGVFNSHRPPLYPLFLRGVYALSGARQYTTVFVVQSVVSSLLIIVMYWTVSRMWNKRAGIIAAALCALYPNFLLYNLTTLTESFGVAIVVAMMGVAASRASDRRKAIAQGVVMGLGMLLKPAFLFFVPGLLIALKKRLVFAATLAFVLSPWILYNAMHEHKLILVSDTGAVNFYMSYNPEAKGGFVAIENWENISQLDYLKRGLDFIRRHKLRTVEIIHAKIFVLFELGWDRHVFRDIVPGTWAVYAAMYGYLGMFVFGFIGLVRRFRKAHAPLVYPLLSYVLLLILLSIFVVRFRSLYEPLLIAYTGILFAGAADTRFDSVSPPRSARRAGRRRWRFAVSGRA